MKTLISLGDIQRAHAATEEALKAAYGPMEVGSELLCWEGRIANVVDKADGLVKAGTLTAPQVQELIAKYTKTFHELEGKVREAQDHYWDLCQQANIGIKVFKRPPCPCRFCATRNNWEAVEDYKRAITQCVETDFANSEALETARKFAELCKTYGYTVEINMV